MPPRRHAARSRPVALALAALFLLLPPLGGGDAAAQAPSTPVRRLAWGTVNVLVYGDTANGVHVWAATTEAAGDARPQFVGRFHPDRVLEWANGAAVLLDAPAPPAGDTATVYQVPLVGLDTALAVVLRRRKGDRWDGDPVLYLAGRDRERPLNVSAGPSHLRALVDTLFTTAAQSGYRPPAAAGTMVWHNPLDSTNAVRPRRGWRGPRYPPHLQHRGVGGEVWLRFTVDGTGRVAEGSIVPLLSDDDAFLDAVTAALRGMRFDAPRTAGRPVAHTVHQRFVFRVAGS